MNYRQQTLAVMNRVEMVVALYDGMIRFLHSAIASIEAGDAESRRRSIGRVLEILVYLQARLRPEVGGESAAALSEFYSAMYAQCVRASRDASVALCEQSIRDIRNVRDAWQVAAEKESPATEQARDYQMQQHLLRSRESAPAMHSPTEAFAGSGSNRWSA
jgi:flagellar protein FliS